MSHDTRLLRCCYLGAKYKDEFPPRTEMKLLRVLADVVVPALALFAIGLALYLCGCASAPPRPDDGRNNDLCESMP